MPQFFAPISLMEVTQIMPSNFTFSKRSLDNLQGVHPVLVKVIHRALEITLVDFMVTEGRRTVERQKELVTEGKSQTMASRHLTGHAVDLAAFKDGKVTWSWEEYEKLAIAVKAAAKDFGVPVVWGGDWKSFKDGVHFELDRRAYP